MCVSRRRREDLPCLIGGSGVDQATRATPLISRDFLSSTCPVEVIPQRLCASDFIGQCVIAITLARTQTT